ncbi:acid protease [Aureobasidium subglaciale]|nr:acid protease [Aureobasidium subglaciale]
MNAKTVELALMSSVGGKDGQGYYTNISVGTPGQLHTVLVDTGSGLTILPASNASFCESHACDLGTFDSSNSSTFKTTHHEALSIQYVDWSFFEGDYFTDVVQLSDAVISNVTMGLAKRVGLSFAPYAGTLGLGTDRSDDSSKPEVPSFVESLARAGAISSRLYSIYLNTLDQYGSILFGGVDNDKYNGPLTTLNCFRSPIRGLGSHEMVDNFFLTLQKITLEAHDGSKQTILRSTNGTTHYTVPDTGTPDWQLPLSAYYKVLGFAGVEEAGDDYCAGGVPNFIGVRPCADVTRGITNTTRFELTLAGNGTNSATLRFELADLFAPISSKNGVALTNDAGQAMCRLQVSPVDDDWFSVTSSSVMRAGYWVFDLDNGQVSLAQANLQANSSNVVEVDAGVDGLSKAATNHRAEVQQDRVYGGSPVSMVLSLSTATNTVGYATGAESYPVVTGRTAHEYCGPEQ